MIRPFTVFCKLNQITFSDRQWLEKEAGSLSHTDGVCPVCHHRFQSDVKEKREASKNSSEMEERSLEVMPETRIEPFKEKVTEKKVAAESSKSKATQNKTDRKQVFSFRATVRNINVWKSFATATGRTMESIGTDAMNEYMKKHRLSDDETAVLKALLAKYESR